MRLAAIFVMLGTIALPARAGGRVVEEKYPFDASAIKDHLMVIHDGQGHYIALLPPRSKVKSRGGSVLYGDDEELFVLRTISSSSSPGKFSFSFWDSRMPNPGVQLFFENKSYKVRCGKTEVVFTELAADKRRAFFDKVRFYEARWQRRAYALARDDRGNYFFVDRSQREDRRRDFHLYVGKAGRMKQQRMKNIVSDSEGDIFSTPRGTLRLVLNKNEAVWIRGKRRTRLLKLPLWPNRQMIYNDLGVYTGRRLGTPCDDI